MARAPRRVHRVTREGPGEAGQVAPEKRVSGSGQTRTWNAFSNAEGRFHVGHWQGEPGITTVRYTEDEFCLILEGRVRLDGPEGSVEFGPGDAFVIEAGFLGTWETLEPVTKLYAIYDPGPRVIP